MSHWKEEIDIDPSFKFTLFNFNVIFEFAQMIPYDLFAHQTFIFINVSYGSFSKEITIIWSDLVTATKRLTPGNSSIPAQFSLFSLYFMKLISIL